MSPIAPPLHLHSTTEKPCVRVITADKPKQRMNDPDIHSQLHCFITWFNPGHSKPSKAREPPFSAAACEYASGGHKDLKRNMRKASFQQTRAYIHLGLVLLNHWSTGVGLHSSFLPLDVTYCVEISNSATDWAEADDCVVPQLLSCISHGGDH